MKILEMENVSKSFGGSKALQNVQVSVEQGEIHALLGENGAGKSTLMNILSGVITRDTGKIVFDGQRIESPSIHLTEKLGIAFVHQELNVINDLRVFENIFLCREETNKFGTLNKKSMIQKSKELFESLGVDINPIAYVSNLKTSEKQLLVISKALFYNAKLSILDEPTTSLSREEVSHLFSILNKLKAEGKSFIFISHKMPEIFEIADSYTVLRNGQYITSGRICDTTAAKVTGHMVGGEYTEQDIYHERTLGDPVLELKHFTGNGFSDVSLKVRKGEIVAFTGLAGCGASEVMHCIFGDSPVLGGSLKVNGKDVSGTGISKRMRAGIALLPANRKENSVIQDMSILENMYLSEHVLSARRFHIFKTEEQKKFEKMKEMLSIKAGASSDGIISLSGGNQQKVFFARWLNTEADILLLDNPTQGVDVGAKAEIYKLILRFAEEGKTIIINTLEIPEIQKVADRCIVFYDGRIEMEYAHSEINEHEVMLHSTNAVNTKEV